MAETPLAFDRYELLAVLARGEYRGTLSELQARPDGVTSLTDLADERHTHEPDGPVPTAIRLHHAILPKLDDVGLLDYDPREHAVRYRSSERVESWLNRIEDAHRDAQ